ncbi:hypothetical protein [Brachyspira innocens]|uniref:hypothetical protein n=1 Tax=Brachyspira innocens TaxID=13264 RepID=UPI00037F41BC|nr:hypothetical protein [Brachyspira innocens]
MNNNCNNKRILFDPNKLRNIKKLLHNTLEFIKNKYKNLPEENKLTHEQYSYIKKEIETVIQDIDQHTKNDKYNYAKIEGINDKLINFYDSIKLYISPEELLKVDFISDNYAKNMNLNDEPDWKNKFDKIISEFIKLLIEEN